jgi:hypothetical protein
MVAEVGNFDADGADGVDQVLARLDLDLDSVDKKFDLFSHGVPYSCSHRLGAAAIVGHVRLEFVPELVQIAAYRHGAGGREDADGFHLDIVAQVLRSRRTSSMVPFAAQDLLDDLQHPAETFAAGSALAAGFMMVEIDEVLHQLDDIHRLVEDDDAAGAEHGLVGGHGFVVEGGVLASSGSSTGVELPPGMMPLSFAPFQTPPATLSITSSAAAPGAVRTCPVFRHDRRCRRDGCRGFFRCHRPCRRRRRFRG